MTKSSIRKAIPILVILSAVLLILRLLSFVVNQQNFLDATFTEEMRSAYQITGAVLETNPELEEIIAQTLKSQELALYEKGLSVLEKYGYGEQLLSSHNKRYQNMKYDQSAELIKTVSTIFVFLMLSCIYSITR